VVGLAGHEQETEMTTWTTKNGTKIEYKYGFIRFEGQSAKVIAIRKKEGMLIAQIGVESFPVEVAEKARKAVFSDFTAR
jgi:hypothetical protein